MASLGAVLLALAVTGVVPATGAAAGDWPEFRADPVHSGTNPAETTIGTANVASLVTRWTATPGEITSSPAVVNGVAYIGGEFGNLYAYDAAGSANCSGSPSTCSPLWTGATGQIEFSSPAVANGVVYVGSRDFNLYAFDATGTTSCSGSPKTCSPLWTAQTGGEIRASAVVVNGIVYISSNDGKLYAFDAAGSTNCSGTPKTCSPLWTGSLGNAPSDSSPAVANGVVYVGAGDGNLYAFDAAGTTNCSGTPKVCSPLWRASTAGDIFSSPAVVNGVVYAGSADGKLYAFDAAGTTGCSGTPKLCSPLWTATTGALISSSPAVANGVVYIGSQDHKLYAFDAAGSTNCSGTPKTCSPLWTATTGNEIDGSSPAVANGVVYIGSTDGKLYAFDAAGTTGCSGSPKTCGPLFSANVGVPVQGSPAVANAMVYLGSNAGTFYAFGLPQATPSLSTQASPGNLLGAPVQDTAMLGGGASPGGTITFRLFGPDDTGCGRPEVFKSIVAVSGNGTYNSESFTPAATGTYRWTADYSGDPNNTVASSGCNANNESVTIAPFVPPPCTRNLVGDVTGPVTVNAGESVCVNNARVVGPITVNAGGALTVAGSRITNGVLADAPSFFSLCGTQVSAPTGNPAQGVIVTNAQVPVRVGDPAAGCAANTVAGDVSLSRNTTGLTVGGNTVSRNVTVNTNQGAIVVKANRVFATLACTGNVPPPTNAGQPNTAASKTGQCVGL